MRRRKVIDGLLCGRTIGLLDENTGGLEETIEDMEMWKLNRGSTEI